MRARLEEQGFTCFRTAGSRSPVDLLAFREGTVLFVQCKSGQRGISRRERMALVDLATDCGATAAVARRGGIVEVLA
jgi:Holliday junction resolvase